MIILKPWHTCIIIHRHPSTNPTAEVCVLHHNAAVDNALKGFKCTGLYPYNYKATSGDKFLPSTHDTKTIQNLKLVLQQLSIKQQWYY
jgi:hypothetical protein